MSFCTFFQLDIYVHVVANFSTSNAGMCIYNSLQMFLTSALKRLQVSLVMTQS